MREISTDEIRGLLSEVIAENGADNTAQCYYVYDGEPHCIAGQVFAKLGVPVDYLAMNEGTGASGIAENLSWEEGWQFAEDGVFLLDNAQGLQDVGYEWGEAVVEAERRLTQEKIGSGVI